MVSQELMAEVRAVEAGVLPAMQSLLYILVVALFLMTFTVQPFRIPSESMEPTLLVGDFLLVDKQAVGGEAGWMLPTAEIRRRDVVVFHYPVDPKVHLVKRVIGMPGDRLHLKDGRVYINGKLMDEHYTVYLAVGPDEYRDNFPRLNRANPAVNAEWWIRMRTLVRDGDLTVPPDSYFVMGDNRNDSEDSRYWGLVPRSAIVGEPLLVYFSLREKSADMTGGSGFARWSRMFRIVR
jgi:signal peptidase I